MSSVPVGGRSDAIRFTNIETVPVTVLKYLNRRFYALLTNRFSYGPTFPVRMCLPDSLLEINHWAIAAKQDTHLDGHQPGGLGCTLEPRALLWCTSLSKS